MPLLTIINIMSDLIKILLLLTLLWWPFEVLSHPRSVLGSTYPIIEEDFLEYIQSQWQKKIENGEWAQWQAQQTTNLKNYANRPTPVVGLTAATENRSWYYDPTISVTRAIGITFTD